jgi:hypothetical protein
LGKQEYISVFSVNYPENQMTAYPCICILKENGGGENETD